MSKMKLEYAKQYAENRLKELTRAGETNKLNIVNRIIEELKTVHGLNTLFCGKVLRGITLEDDGLPTYHVT